MMVSSEKLYLLRYVYASMQSVYETYNFDSTILNPVTFLYKYSLGDLWRLLNFRGLHYRLILVQYLLKIRKHWIAVLL